ARLGEAGAGVASGRRALWRLGASPARRGLRPAHCPAEGGLTAAAVRWSARGRGGGPPREKGLYSVERPLSECALFSAAGEAHSRRRSPRCPLRRQGSPPPRSPPASPTPRS